MSVETVARTTLLVALAVSAVVDLREQRIPDAVLWPAFALVAAARLVAGRLEPGLALDWVATAACGFVVFTLVRLASGGRLGLGDAKLAAFVGFVLGVRGWLVALLIASGTGAAVAVVLIAGGKLRRSDAIPFAPFLALGVAGALLAEPLLARAIAAAAVR